MKWKFEADTNVLRSVTGLLGKLGIEQKKVYLAADKTRYNWAALNRVFDQYGIKVKQATATNKTVIEQFAKLSPYLKLSATSMGSLVMEMEKGELSFDNTSKMLKHFWGDLSTVGKVAASVTHGWSVLKMKLGEVDWWSKIKSGVSGVVGAVGGFFKNLVSWVPILGLLGTGFGLKDAFESAKDFSTLVFKMSAMFGSKGFGQKMASWAMQIRTQIAISKEELASYFDVVQKFGVNPFAKGGKAGAQQLGVLQGLAAKTGSDFNTVLNAVSGLANPMTRNAGAMLDLAQTLNFRYDPNTLMGLMTKLSAGGGDFESSFNIITKFFKGAGEWSKQWAATPEGMISRWQAAIDIIRVSIGNGLVKYFTTALGGLLKWVNDPKNMKTLTKIGTYIGETFGMLSNSVWTFVKHLFGVNTNIESVGKNLEGFFKNTVAPFMFWLNVTMGKWGTNIHEWFSGSGFKDFLQNIRDVWDALVGVAKTISEIFGWFKKIDALSDKSLGGIIHLKKNGQVGFGRTDAEIAQDEAKKAKVDSSKGAASWENWNNPNLKYLYPKKPITAPVTPETTVEQSVVPDSNTVSFNNTFIIDGGKSSKQLANEIISILNRQGHAVVPVG